MDTVYFNLEAYERYMRGYSNGKVDREEGIGRYSRILSTDNDFIMGYDDGYDGKPRGQCKGGYNET